MSKAAVFEKVQSKFLTMPGKLFIFLVYELVSWNVSRVFLQVIILVKVLV